MALVKPSVPDICRWAIQEGLSGFDRGDLPPANALISAPHALHVYSLRLDYLDQGKPLDEAAKPVGWRFLAGNPNGQAFALDVTEPAADSPPKMVGFSRDPLVAAAIRTLNEVETLPECQNAHYELRVLRIPSMLIEAIWLKSLGDGADLAVPVLTRSRRLQVNRAYPMAEFLGIIRPLAEVCHRADALYAD